MTLEVRLNVATFYQRLAHYAFTNDCLEAWATDLIDEIMYYQQTDELVSKLGLSNFHCFMPFSNHCFEWSENFRLLAGRLANSLKQPPLWCDVFALQM
jgi:hypothetical protein